MIDTHHHLWKYNPEEYGWMDDSMTTLKRDYLPADLEKKLRNSGVTGTVVVQARQKVEETRWLLELADMHAFIKGVVGWFDLCSPELNGVLEEYANNPGLVGVRHVIHDEPDDGFMLRRAFMKGIEALERYGLVYDLLLFPRHLKNAVKLVEAFPRQRFVLDHLGKPQINAGIMEPWRSGIRKMARYSNAWCKLSGMVTEADHTGWVYEDLLPYMEVVLEAFGPERIMVGSDWPVCSLAGEYSQVMDVVRKFTEPMCREDREKILFQNAVECYHLKTKLNGEAKIQGS
jgi:L-fuconolactonase